MKRKIYYYSKLMWVLLVVCLLSLQAAAQQTNTISGIVTSNGGGAVIGATVLIKNTNRGTTTDVSGRFTLANVLAEDVIILSYIGYTAQEIGVQNQTMFEITLHEDTQSLDEVIVVGYGIQRKSDLTGAVTSVKAADVLKSSPSSDVSSALQGRMAGVTVVGGGDPSKGSTIRIRGVNSVTAESAPLVVVDGFIGGSLKNLNPADIQSIEVLKDASATAVYGSRGANGVILVTTKTPFKDQLLVSVNAFMNMKTLPNAPDLLSPAEFANLANDYGREYNASDNNKPAKEYYTPNQIADFASGKDGYDYIDNIFNSPAVSQNYEVSISGGSDKTNFLTSLRYEKSQGTIKNSEYDAVNWRLKVDTKLRKYWKVGMNFYGNMNNYSGPRMSQYNGLLMTAMHFPNTMNPYNEKGEYNNIYAIGGGAVYNPMGHINEIDSNARRITNNMQGYMEFNIVDGLTLRSQLGVVLTNNMSTEYNNEKSYNRYLHGETSAKATTNYNWSWLNTNILNYTKEFNKDHRINATAVFEQSYSNSFYLQGVGTDMTFDSLGPNSLGSSATQKASTKLTINTLLSGMFRANYVFKDKYMFTASIRADGSSRLQEKWDYFPSAAIAWNVKQESFMQDIDVMSQFKLRVGYGSVGNQAIEPYRIYSQMVPVTNPDGTTSYTPGRPASEHLRWERNDQINIGADLGFFNGRLAVTVDWYNKQSKDVLMEIKQADHIGWGELLQNACEIRNTGFEIMLSGDPINKDDWGWHTDLTLTNNTATFQNIPTLDRTQLQSGEFENQIFKMIEGEKVSSFWGYTADGVWKTDEIGQSVTVYDANGVAKTGTYASIYGVVAGQQKLVDVNNDGKFGEEDKGIIGNGQPTFNWGWNNNIRYKNFDLSVFVVGFHGFDVYNVPRQSALGNTAASVLTDAITPNREWLNRWTPDNQDTDIPGFVKIKKAVKGYNSAYVEDGSFVKVKSITLGYNLPEQVCKKMNINNVRVYVSLQNPFMITDYKGIDPEVALTNPLVSGVDWAQFPDGRNYMVGLNFTF